MASPPALVLSCSPRAGGNSDFAADLAAGILNAPVLRLRDHAVTACIGCGACSAAAPRITSLEPEEGKPYLGCPLSLKDDSTFLLASLARAPFVLLTSPVYFYHLPAGFKALIDRLQPFWALREAGNIALAALPARSCGVILCAGRPKGDRLFEGSLLTLRWSLGLLNLRLREPLELRNVDEAKALAHNPSVGESIQEYAAACATSFAS